MFKFPPSCPSPTRGEGTFLIILFTLFLTACHHDQPWNNPYPSSDATANYYYASFSEQPKTLDPARSYSTNETLFIAQIYEPPLQYDYLKRPYTLEPLTATAMPEVSYVKVGKDITYTLYTIHIKPHIYFQPHPAFARKPNGEYYYHHLTEDEVEDKYQLSDFAQTGTRELTAADYVYQIKRLLDPQVDSPIAGFLNRYIVSATALDKYTYQIKIKGNYPQFIYWLAMPFFAPMPWEAEVFYAQPGMKDNNITLAWYPVGTGPYMLTENNPNRRMVLVRNPNFRGENYPWMSDECSLNPPPPNGVCPLLQRGRPSEARRGILELPFIDKFIFTLEKESIPRWNKFLQGYYDASTISSDSFDQAIYVNPNGQAEVTPYLKDKHIRLQISTEPSDSYFGFNMLDPVVGGYSERARKLRQAISIAINSEEFIAIFLNGRGIAAQGPLPPEIFGYQTGAAGINPYVYRWANDHAERKSIEEAKRLLVEAGYPDGRDPKTGEPLLLNFDVAGGSSSDDRSLFTWLRKQFASIGIQLQIRDTQYNRFQEKMRMGQAQIFSWGWVADYPDPENFLFLFYGPNAKVKFSGENATNYHNPEFDKLFVQMRDLPNGAERQAVINRMVEILRQDAPWVWGFHPQSFVLSQSWVGPLKPNAMANNTLQYVYIDPQLRAKQRIAWNQPILWPIGVGLLLLFLILSPLFYFYWQRQHKTKK